MKDASPDCLENINLDQTLADLQLEGLNLADFIQEVDEEFNTFLEDSEVQSCYTLRDVTTCIIAHLNNLGPSQNN